MTNTIIRLRDLNDTVTIADSLGGELGTIELELDEDGTINMTMSGEEGAVLLGLDIAETEALIAKLAVKVAQARMTQPALRVAA